MKLTETIIDLVNTLTNCGINESGNIYYVYVDNPCGQDFELEIQKGDNEVEDIIQQCENYDPEEEFRVWYGANNGEPSSPRTLFDNCEKIGDNLDELSRLLKDTNFSLIDTILEDNPKLNLADAYAIVDAGHTEVLGVFKDKDDASRDYICSRLGQSDFDLLEFYINFEDFADQVLLESDGYMELDSGKIVSVE